MIYFDASKELKIFSEFCEDVKKLWEIEDEAWNSISDDFMLSHERQPMMIRIASQTSGYLEVRARIAGNMRKIVGIGRKNRIPTEFKSFPPAAVGGPVLDVNIFEAILNDNSWGGIGRQVIVDAMNGTLSACVERKEKEFFDLFNPFFWLSAILGFVLRLPFWVISKTGFNVSKIEDQFLGKLSKLLFLLILLYVFIKLGFSKEQIGGLVSKLAP